MVGWYRAFLSLCLAFSYLAPLYPMPYPPTGGVSPMADPGGVVVGPVARVELRVEVLAGSAASTEGAPVRDEIWEYEDGLPIRHVVEIDGRPALESRYRYERRQLVSISQYDEAGMPQSHQRLVYGDLDELTREVTEDGQGRVESTVTYQYSEGRVVAASRFGPGGQLEWRRLFAPQEGGMAWDLLGPAGRRITRTEVDTDARGRIVEERRWEGPGATPSTSRYQYTDAGLLSRSETIGPDGAVIDTLEREYDSRGNIVVHRATSPATGAATTSSTEYVYDDAGNWIEARTRTRAGINVAAALVRDVLMERRITYASGAMQGDATQGEATRGEAR